MDKYYRQLKTNKKDVENSLKIGCTLINISSNSEKIGNNENSISSNLGKIGNNENSISSNLGKINNIKNDMSIKIKKDIYEKTFIIPNMYTNYNSKQ